MIYQDINKKWAALSLVMVISMIGGIANLTGVSYTEPGDTYWEWNSDVGLFESVLDFSFNTTYYNICFEPTADVDRPEMYKKVSTSRTMWVKYDPQKFIHTFPQVSTVLLVPTYGSKWREAKTGDCIKRGQVNKIRVMAYTDVQQKVKWSLKLEHWAIEDVDIDPFILPKDQPVLYSYEPIVECKNVTTTVKVPTEKMECVDKTEEHCDDWQFLLTVFEEITVTNEVCSEIGVTVSGSELDYQTDSKNCIRTDNTLCCWNINDGGLNIDERDVRWRKVIRSGEDGVCTDLTLSTKVLEFESRSVLQ